jgi:hypothetical protein
MTDDEIIEMAERVWGYNIEKRVQLRRVMEFARLIIERQKEIDAGICESWVCRHLAEAIRSQK